MNRYRHLIAMIRNRNTTAVILLSAIIPRPCDFQWSKPLIYGVNVALQSWCCIQEGLIFLPTYNMYKLFLHCGALVLEYYSSRDLLHLNGPGTEKLEQLFRQALSPTNLKLCTAPHWKHKPLRSFHNRTPATPFWMV